MERLRRALCHLACVNNSLHNSVESESHRIEAQSSNKVVMANGIIKSDDDVSHAQNDCAIIAGIENKLRQLIYTFANLQMHEVQVGCANYSIPAATSSKQVA